MRRTVLITALGLLLLAAPICSWADTGDNVPSSYPGVGPQGGVTLVATGMVNRCLSAYYRLYEVWPTKWQEVVDAGLCQVELRTTTGQSINPDDGVLNFYEDLFYHYRGPSERPQVLQMYDWGGRVTRTATLGGGTSYAERTKTIRETLDIHAQLKPSELAGYVKRKDILQRHAIYSMIVNSQNWYYVVHQRAPRSFTELLDSGLCPFDSRSINPLTGRRFVDGVAPFGVEIIPSKTKNPRRAPKIIMYDENSQVIPPIY